MFDVLFLVLAVCYSGRNTISSPPTGATHVDRIELNHYWWAAGCESHQVIIWRWSASESRYRADHFFFVAADGSDNPYRFGRKWRFVYRSPRNPRNVRVFETEDVIETVTAYDPWARDQAR